jgi:GT2 family glycosyltransferase
MYAEDLDLCWRVKHAGWQVVYEPSAQVRHELGAATKQAFGRKLDVRWQTAAWAWMTQRRGLATTRATALLELTFSLGRLARRLLLPWRLFDEAGRARLARDWSYVRAAALGLRSRRALLARR